MALSQQAASRFFSAFYRWNRYARIGSNCPLYRSQNGIHRRSLKTTITRRQTHARDTQEQITQRIVSPACSDDVSPADIAVHLQRPEEHGESVEDEGLAELKNETSSERQPRQNPEGGSGDGIRLLLNQSSVRPQPPTASERDMPAIVRKVMRNTPQSVVVITTTAGDEADSAMPLGIAVSSFSTVSLNPPTVSFNVKPPSRTLDAINSAGGKFLVHFFINDGRAARIASLFTKGNTEEELKTRGKVLSDMLPQSSSIQGSWTEAFKITDDTVAAIMQCELTQAIPVADHMIVVAKVVDVEAKGDHALPLLLYSQGRFSRHEPNTPLDEDVSEGSTSDAPQLIRMFKKHPLWSGKTPLRPSDRTQVRENLLEYVKSRPHLLNVDPYQARFLLTQELAIPFDPLGIRLIGVFADAAQATGRKSRANPVELELPPVSDLEPPLMAQDRATIIERSIELIRSDPLFLAMSYEQFFYLVGISPFGHGDSVLASEILNPLRSEGVVAPFQPAEGSVYRLFRPGKAPTLEDFEQIEHRLRQRFRSEKFSVASRARLKDLLNEPKATGVMVSIAMYIRTRLLIEAFPDVYRSPNCGFSGNLTQAEARIAISCILSHLSVPAENDIRDRLPRQTPYELLRACKIHPHTTGPDLDLYMLIHQLYHWFSVASFGDFRKRLFAMRDSIFRSKITSSMLKSRYDQIVREDTLRLSQWNEVDLWDALGVSQTQTFVLEDGKYRQLHQADVIEALHLSIDEQYPNFSAEQRLSVDKFKQNTAHKAVRVVEKDPVGPFKMRKYSSTSQTGAISSKLDDLNSIDENSVETGLIRKIERKEPAKRLNSNEVLLRALGIVGKNNKKSSSPGRRSRAPTAFGFDGKRL